MIEIPEEKCGFVTRSEIKVGERVQVVQINAHFSLHIYVIFLVWSVVGCKDKVQSIAGGTHVTTIPIPTTAGQAFYLEQQVTCR